MKNIITFCAIITLTFFVKGQKEFNPFESIGKEGKMLTLSSGKYVEVEMYDSLQRIGSVIINRNTGEIHELLSIDDTSEFRYDPTTFSRWYAIDPKASKYPNVSPYAFVNNNPIINKEVDGRDYILVINHETKTITVKATYYTTENMKAEAESAIQGWNSQSGEYNYSIGKGNEAVSYSINFELKIATHDSDGNPLLNGIDVDLAFEKDKSGAANTYKVGNFPDILPDHGYTSTEPALGRGASVIRVLPDKQEQRKTGTHEVGHTLGILHWTKGLMKKGPLRLDSETQITKNMIFRILKTGGVNPNAMSSGMDYEMADDGANHDGRAKATQVVEGNSTEPIDFHNGKVTNQKKSE